MKTLEEIKQEMEHKKQLITLNNQHLQILRERKARFGFDTPPHIIMEIQQIERELEELDAAWQTLKQEYSHLEAPLIHLQTYGGLEQSLPENTYLIDWSDVFNRETTPRKIPGPAVWESRLWAELRDLERAKLKRKGVVRVQGGIALSAGFALGRIFAQEAQYQLRVAQGLHFWRSDAALEAVEPTFRRREIPGQADADGIAVVVNALQGQDSNDLVSEVQGYLLPAGGARKVLLFEAEKPVKAGQFLTGEEVAVLARTSKPALRKFVKQNPAETLHVFLATPAGLAIFLGHYWNAIGIAAQLYEWAGITGQYLPSCRVLLN